MANNIISYALLNCRIDPLRIDYATKLDRLAMAAGDACMLLSACDDAPSKSAAAALRTILRELELPREPSNES